MTSSREREAARLAETARREAMSSENPRYRLLLRLRRALLNGRADMAERSGAVRSDAFIRSLRVTEVLLSSERELTEEELWRGVEASATAASLISGGRPSSLVRDGEDEELRRLVLAAEVMLS